MLQEKLAEALDVDQSTYSRWESGKNWPTIEVAIKLAKLLGVRVGWLAYEDGPENDETDSVPPAWNEAIKTGLLGRIRPEDDRYGTAFCRLSGATAPEAIRFVEQMRSRENDSGVRGPPT